jgi:hypothetical protein
MVIFGPTTQATLVNMTINDNIMNIVKLQNMLLRFRGNLIRCQLGGSKKKSQTLESIMYS